MHGLNKVMLMGYIGNHPAIHVGSSTHPKVTFSLATCEQYTKKNSEGIGIYIEWHNITAFGKLADAITDFIVKDTYVYVEGKIRTTKSVDDRSNPKYRYTIVAEKVTPLGGYRPPNSLMNIPTQATPLGETA